MRTIEKSDFNVGTVAFNMAKRIRQKMRCHVCNKAVEWRDVSVQQSGRNQWHCECLLCESGMSSNEFLEWSTAGPVSPMKSMKIVESKAMKATKAMKAVKAMKATKAMKAMKANK